MYRNVLFLMLNANTLNTHTVNTLKNHDHTIYT